MKSQPLNCVWWYVLCSAPCGSGYESPACRPSAWGSQPRKWSKLLFSIMTTMTCSMPDFSGLGSATPRPPARSSRTPEAPAPVPPAAAAPMPPRRTAPEAPSAPFTNVRRSTVMQIPFLLLSGSSCQGFGCGSIGLRPDRFTTGSVYDRIGFDRMDLEGTSRRPVALDEPPPSFPKWRPYSAAWRVRSPIGSHSVTIGVPLRHRAPRAPRRRSRESSRGWRGPPRSQSGCR